MTLFGRRKVPEQFIISDGDDADFFRGGLEGFFSEDSLTMRDYFIRQKSATLSEETRQHQGTYQSGDEAGVAGRYQQAPSFQQKKIAFFMRNARVLDFSRRSRHPKIFAGTCSSSIPWHQQKHVFFGRGLAKKL